MVGVIMDEPAFTTAAEDTEDKKRSPPSHCFNDEYFRMMIKEVIIKDVHHRLSTIVSAKTLCHAADLIEETLWLQSCTCRHPYERVKKYSDLTTIHTRVTEAITADPHITSLVWSRPAYRPSTRTPASSSSEDDGGSVSPRVTTRVF